MSNDEFEDEATIVGCNCDVNELEESDDFLSSAAKVMDDDYLVSSIGSVSTIKYAPVQPPVRGKYTLYGVALKWLNNPGASLSSVTSVCRQAAQVYKDLSNGYLDFKVIAKAIKVDYGRSARNIPKAEKQAKDVIGVPADLHLYCMFNNNAKDFNNAGNDTAHLSNTLLRTVLHEMGHCHPTELGHSGVYKDGKLDPYADGTSFMGKFPSTKLTGAQLYLLGWLPQNKVALCEIGDLPTDYNVQSLFGSNDNDYVKVVLIPRGTQRPLYLSMPQIDGEPKLCLHLANGRGTQRITVFGKRVQYENLLFQKVLDGEGFVKVRVSTI